MRYVVLVAVVVAVVALIFLAEDEWALSDGGWTTRTRRRPEVG